MKLFLQLAGGALVVYVLIVLVVTFVDVRNGPDAEANLLTLVGIVFSWDVVLPALLAGFTVRFDTEIAGALGRLGS